MPPTSDEGLKSLARQSSTSKKEKSLQGGSSQPRSQSREPSSRDVHTNLLRDKTSTFGAIANLFLSKRDQPSVPRSTSQQAKQPSRQDESLYLSKRDKATAPPSGSQKSSRRDEDLYLSKRDKTPAPGSESRNPSRTDKNLYLSKRDRAPQPSIPSQPTKRPQPLYPSKRNKSTTPRSPSQPPTNTKTFFHDSEDWRFAQRQKKINTLPPPLRKEQEDWAQSLIARCGPCPQKYAWARKNDGYHCEGGNHFITDSLLAEGRGGLMFIPLDLEGKWGVRWGPYYLDDGFVGKKGKDGKRGVKYIYGGEMDKGRHPRGIPRSILEPDSMLEFDMFDDPSASPVVKEKKRREMLAEKVSALRAAKDGGGR